MHLLYVDESGHSDDPTQRYFVMIGIALFERQTWWLSSELDKIALRFDPANPQTVELHGSPMKQGKGVWSKVSGNERFQAFRDALEVFAKSHPSNRLFGVVIEKAVLPNRDIVEYAFEQLLSRFDQYLMRLHKQEDTQRGIVILDRSIHEKSLQSLATEFRTIGHTWGILRNFAEVPLFIDSKASRLVQLADLIAYSVFRHYERADSEFFHLIEPRFDRVAGVNYGLHIKRNQKLPE